MSRPDKNPWTHNQIQLLRKMVDARAHYDLIVQATGHSVCACKTKACEQGFTLQRKSLYLGSEKEHRKPQGKTRTMRPCLSCNVRFQSEGAHNRLCARCRINSLSSFDTPARIGQ